MNQPTKNNPGISVLGLGFRWPGRPQGQLRRWRPQSVPFPRGVGDWGEDPMVSMGKSRKIMGKSWKFHETQKKNMRKSWKIMKNHAWEPVGKSWENMRGLSRHGDSTENIELNGGYSVAIWLLTGYIVSYSWKLIIEAILVTTSRTYCGYISFMVVLWLSTTTHSKAQIIRNIEQSCIVLSKAPYIPYRFL